MSTAHDLPLAFGEPSAAPALRLVPAQPLDFDDAVRRVRPRLHRYAIRRLGDSHEAEELVQEALLRAYTHREQFLTEEDLSAWTTVVTGRLVIDRLRVRGRSTSVAEVPENGRMGRDTADVVVGRDEARTALDALDAMPVRQASLLWAREVEGQTYEELCARFDMTEPAVRSVLTRARKALRKEYAVRGGTLPVGGLAVLAPWIAGMTWADKLRAAVGRVTGPAALATIGVTTLGALMISPFGAGIGESSTFTPERAVVSASSTVAPDEARLHPSFPSTLPGAATATALRRTSAGAAVQPDAYDRSPLKTTCAKAPSSSDKGGTTVRTGEVEVGDPGTSPDGTDVGDKSCSRASDNRESVLFVDQELPENPTGFRYVGVQSDVIPCDSITPIPGAIGCTPATNTNGAQK